CVWSDRWLMGGRSSRLGYGAEQVLRGGYDQALRGRRHRGRLDDLCPLGSFGCGGKIQAEAPAANGYRLRQSRGRDRLYGDDADIGYRHSAQGAGLAGRPGKGVAQLQFGSLPQRNNLLAARGEAASSWQP